MIDELNKICVIKKNASLDKLNTFRIKSKCKFLVYPKSIIELKRIVKLLNKNNIKFFILGNGSNIILPSYYDGVAISLKKFNNYSIKKKYVEAESGCMLNKLSSIVTNLGYSGLDFSVGIPGSVGGSVYGNAGCYGSSISEILIDATIFDGNKVIKLKNKDLDFGYRTSIFKKNKNYIILSCRFKINPSDKNELKRIVLERTKKRIESQDLSHPSNGSVFRNPQNIPAGKMIEDMNFKGFSINDAMVSYKHANFIINNGNATQEDIIKLIDIIKEKAKKEYDIDLILEQEIIK